MEYRLIYESEHRLADAISSVEAQVNRLLAEGWHTYAQPSVATMPGSQHVLSMYVVMQAMTRLETTHVRTLAGDAVASLYSAENAGPHRQE